MSSHDVASIILKSLGTGVTLQPGDETAAPGAITLPENWVRRCRLNLSNPR